MPEGCFTAAGGVAAPAEGGGTLRRGEELLRDDPEDHAEEEGEGGESVEDGDAPL